MDEWDEDYLPGDLMVDIEHCPACGEPIDYCQGHGEIGDPAGYAILLAHDEGDHRQCQHGEEW